MSIVKMSKIKLMGVNAYKESILNALYKTGCVELSETEEFADTVRVPQNAEEQEISRKYAVLVKTAEFFSVSAERSKGKPYTKDLPADKNYFIPIEDFIRAEKKAGAAFKTAEFIERAEQALAEIRAERVKTSNVIAQLAPYLGVKEKLSDFKNTKTVAVFLGTIKKENVGALAESLSDTAEAQLDVLSEENLSVVAVYAHFSAERAVSQALSAAGFTACPFSFDKTAKAETEELSSALIALNKKEEEVYESVCKRAGELKDVRILCDYYAFILEKIKCANGFSCTGKTFILEGFLPTDSIPQVENAVRKVTGAVITEFSEPEKGEKVPTLLKNSFPVRQAEFITDMYSTPEYREIDPNKSVFFFFMLFMGLIMADIGYGLIMIAAGLALACRIKTDNGARKLWFNVAMGGVFAIAFGILFNSLFGFSVLPFTLLPSPVPSENNPFGLMTILLGCLALGVLQIAFGYFMKALNNFKQGDIAGGIFEGLTWVLFFIGFIFAAFNFLIGYLMPELTLDAGVKSFFDAATMPGLITVAVTVTLAAITAGRKEKGFGKITKGFGAVYGLINIFSDVLSYARLFGLMLSGMIIAQTFNDIGMGMFGSPVGYAIGGLIMLIGHTFNLAMGVLGAYIHDSRLQYIEYFGKFYTGEGDKFRPIGSDLKYVYVTR